GPDSLEGSERAFASDLVGEPDYLFDDRATRELRQTSVHRIGRMEEQRLAPMTSEHEEDLEQELVAAVPEDEPIGLRPPTRREDLAQLVATSGVTIEQHALDDIRREVTSRAIGLGPLVRVDAHVRLELLCGPIGLELRHLRPRFRESRGVAGGATQARGHLHSLTRAGRPRFSCGRPGVAWGR